jgi:hypothetical protein
MQNTDIAMKQLFTAKWNIPQAAKEMGMSASEESWNLVKVLFAEYCKEHSSTWAPSDSTTHS